MPSPTRTLTDWVAEAHGQTEGREWIGRRRGLKAPSAKPDAELFHCARRPDGSWQVERYRFDRRRDPPSDRGAMFVQVSRASRRFELTFAAVAQDGDSNRWDLVLEGRWHVAEPFRFLLSWAVDMVSPDLPLSRRLVESRIANRVRSQLQRAVEQAVAEAGDLERVRGGHVLSPQAMSEQMEEWLVEDGIVTEIERVRWTSADAAAAEAERKRLADLEQAKKERRRQREAELREMAADARYRDEKRRIEADEAISDKERDHRLQLLEERHRKELVETRTQREAARYKAERLALDHELTLVRLHNEIDAEKEVARRQKEADCIHQQQTEFLGKAEQALEKLTALPGEILGKLAGKAAFQTAERVLSPEYGFRTEELQSLGYAGAQQLLVQAAREKALLDGEPLVLSKADLADRTVRCTRVEGGRTRDIGVARVKGLGVNTPLRFELSAQRDGFVTVLNVGTSGRVWLHVPNLYVTPDETRLSSGSTSTVPGPELLPADRLREAGLDYVEAGPPGWEHVVALISDEPLASVEALYRATPACPLVQLEPTEVEELLGRLHAAPSESWSGACLSFLVAGG